MEQRLRELAERGDLSGLPGEGRPLPPEEGQPGDRWAAFRVMQQNKLLPPWAAERREIEAVRAGLERRAAAHATWLVARADLRQTLPADRILDATRVTWREDERVRSELAAAVEALNRRIVRHNTQVPSERLQLQPLRTAALFAPRASGPSSGAE